MKNKYQQYIITMKVPAVCIFVLILIIYCLFLFYPPLDRGWFAPFSDVEFNISDFDPFKEKTVEGMCISRAKYISSAFTTKECQNYCIRKGNCRYTNRYKNRPLGNKQPCWISTGVGTQKSWNGRGCSRFDTWENTKYVKKPQTPFRSVGVNPYQRYYVRCWWTRHRYCRRYWWWRWRCWYGRWHRHCRWYRRNYLRRKMRKGEGDCDRNSDCAGRLKCFQRTWGKKVPGVKKGGPRNWDICYDPRDRDA